MQHANKTRGAGPLGSSGMVGLWGASSLIKSIQRGTISFAGATSGTATIAAVVPENTIVRHLWSSQTSNNTNLCVWFGRSELTNSTTVTASAYANDGTYVGSYEVIEYYPGVIKSKQTGTITLTAASESTDTATITTVDTAKAQLEVTGEFAGNTSPPTSSDMMRAMLTNSTTVTATRGTTGSAGQTNALYFAVWEMF